MYEQLKSLLAEHGKKLLNGGLIAVVTAALALAWSSIEERVQAYIVKTTADNLVKDNGELPTALKAALTNIRQSDVGALTVGSFLLNASNRSFTLYVYFPEGYKGKIIYTLKGDIVPKKRYVVLAAPNSKPIPLKLEEGAIVLEKYFQPPTGQAALLHDVFDDSPTRKLQTGLRPITFQLEGSDTDPAAHSDSASNSAQLGQSAEIEISYVVMITPTIKLVP